MRTEDGSVGVNVFLIKEVKGEYRKERKSSHTTIACNNVMFLAEFQSFQRLQLTLRHSVHQ